MDTIITKEMIHHQAYKFYLAPLLFFAYMVFLPYCYTHLNFFITFLLLFFPGTYLYSWICYLMHETWHKYISTLPNHFLFHLYCCLLASDPQIYRIAHGAHHSHIHTWKDLEFYPLGEVKNKVLDKMINVMRFLFGQLFIYNVSFHVLSKHPKFQWRKHLLASSTIILIYSTFFYLSHVFLQVPTLNIFISWLLITFVAGCITHHSQLIEHWGIITEDKPLNERILMSRNLSSKSIFERIFLFLTHWDSHEHVIHHVNAKIYHRPFVNALPMPEKSVYINLKDYLNIAWGMMTKSKLKNI